MPSVLKEEGSVAMSASTVIRTNGLSKSYDGVPAVKSLDMNIDKNTIVGFLGPNGAGKTTTIKLLLGLTRPTGGSGTVFGLDIVEESIEIRKRVGYLAQDPRFYEYMTARETLRFIARFFFLGPASKIEARIAETLELVDLGSKADRPIKGFSAGERQRLGIAQAYINSPDLLILDEPAASLDPMGRRDVLELLRDLRQYSTILYSTHIIADVERVSDIVIILDHGQLVSQSPIEKLLAGSGGAVYSLVTRGKSDEAQALIASQPWVTSINVQCTDGQATWQVDVTNDEAAEAHLLRLVLSCECLAVTEFGRKKYELEEIFMNILDGGDDVRDQ